MPYSSAGEARRAREALGKALEALQQDADIPEEALGVAQNIAKSVGALFEAEYASTEVDGKTCVKNALGTLSQTLALLQDVKSEHPGVAAATEKLADVISVLFPLINKPSVRPEAPSSRPASAPPGRSAPPSSPAPQASSPPPASSPPVASRPPASSRPLSSRPHPSSPPLSSRPAPSRPPSIRPASSAPAPSRPAPIRPITNRPVSTAPVSSRPPSHRPASTAPSGRPASIRPGSLAPAPIPTSMLPPPAPKPVGDRHRIEANLGATTQSNFYVGFTGEIAHGGVFLATYETLPKDTSVTMLVTLPGGLEFECDGWVRFVRDPLDFASESEPGIGIQFEDLSEEARDLILRFIRKRPPIFYDV